MLACLEFAPEQWAEFGITDEDALLRLAFKCPHDLDTDRGVADYLQLKA